MTEVVTAVMSLAAVTGLVAADSQDTAVVDSQDTVVADSEDTAAVADTVAADPTGIELHSYNRVM
jgi:hypothetical protein